MSLKIVAKAYSQNSETTSDAFGMALQVWTDEMNTSFTNIKVIPEFVGPLNVSEPPHKFLHDGLEHPVYKIGVLKNDDEKYRWERVTSAKFERDFQELPKAGLEVADSSDWSREDGRLVSPVVQFAIAPGFEGWPNGWGGDDNEEGEYGVRFKVSYQVVHTEEPYDAPEVVRVMLKN